MPKVAEVSGSRHAQEAGTGPGAASFAPGEVNFAGRFRDALRRRLAPNTALQLKQLAHAIGKSERAVQMVMAGDIGLHSETVAACIRFFWGLNDRAFLAEIYGLPPLGVIAELRQPLVEALARLEVA